MQARGHTTKSASKKSFEDWKTIVYTDGAYFKGGYINTE